MTDGKNSLIFFKVRISLVMLVILGLWGGLVYRLYVLQVKNSPVLSEKAEKQHEGILRVEPRRGRILDRSRNIFAVSVKVKSLFGVPYEIEDIKTTARMLSQILGISIGEISDKLSRKSKFVWIKRKMDENETRLISEAKLKGIYMLDEFKRYYPKGSILSHVVGFVNIDNEGMEGIERSFNDTLKGKTGLANIIHDAKGRELVASRDFIEEARDGEDVVLTIDEVIQNILEEEIEKIYTEFSPLSVSAMIMDTTDGSILAVANRPTYDLNNVRTTPSVNRKNCALINAYEPGSLFKVVTAAACMNEGVVDLDDVIYCEQGAYYMAGRTLHDSHPYDNLDFRNVIAKSSNIGFAKVSAMITPDVFYNYIREFGFGKPCGLELAGESGGMISHYKKWSGTSQPSIAMGHEIMTTITQLTAALSTIASLGKKVSPRIVSGIAGRDGEFIQKFASSAGDQIIREATARELIQALKLVVSREGTAPKAAVSGYEVAGKTGTARKIVDGQYSNKKHVASFFGFLPADDAKIAITIMVDEPKGKIYGGEVAAPAFSIIGERVMNYMLPRPVSMLTQNTVSKHTEVS